MTLKLENGDCLELMKSLPDKSIDLFICDLPYGETNCKWDCKIDLEEFWIQFKRLRKTKRVACIHFCSSKFGYTLIKSNEKMFKMDMVWVKRNKTGGLQSRHRPMRNHEMVYFFYEQAPKYNRDKYHKRIQPKKEHNIEKEDITMGKSNKMKDTMHKCFDPPNPASVVEEEETDIYGETKLCRKNRVNGLQFDPPNPASVLEEETDHWGKKNGGDKGAPFGLKYDPPNPASVLEEDETLYNKNTVGWSSSENNKTYLKANPGFTPRQPASVLEEKEEKDEFGWDKSVVKEKGTKFKGSNFDPVNPVSVVEEDDPSTTFKSKKVFIGKRHHQTEKPLDILEFFLKYWSDEGDTILDPTMGSGSVGVACKKLNRNFIGFELDEKIFKVAQDRIAK